VEKLVAIREEQPPVRVSFTLVTQKDAEEAGELVRRVFEETKLKFTNDFVRNETLSEFL